VQAISRDILADALQTIAEWLAEHHPSARIIGHVHDEVVIECFKADAQAILDYVTAVLSTSPSWAPDMALSAEGNISERFMKAS